MTDDNSSWAAVRDRVIAIIRNAQPISGDGPEAMADEILRIVQEQETGKLCKLFGLPRAGVLRVWLDDNGKVSVLPVAYEKDITIDVGFDRVTP